MDDTISRQAVIDALCAVCGKSCDKSEFVYNAPQDEQVILCPEHYALCTLPSAQPDVPDTNVGDMISRQAAIDEIRKCRFVVDAIEKIRGLPSAEPKTGEWIHDGYDFPHGNDWIHCSECGKRGINVPADLTNFCPNCGAKMVREDGEA